MKYRVLVGIGVLALCLAPAASAKFNMWLVLDDSTPRVGQSITVVLRSEQNLDYNLRLIAVAPGQSVREVVGTVTGDASRPRARIPHDGFAVPVTRVGPDRWRAFVKFPRTGRWQLVIPNGAAVGFMIPPSAARAVLVAR